MMRMDEAARFSQTATVPHAPAARPVAGRGLIRPLSWLSTLTAAATVSLFTLSRPIGIRWFPSLHLPGLGITVAPLLLATLGLLASLCMMLARGRDAIPSRVSKRGSSVRWMAGVPHTILSLSFTTAASYSVVAAWPLRQETLAVPAGFTAASALLLLATPWLLAERYLASVPKARLPESDDLRNLLFLPVFVLGAQAVMIVAAALGFGTLYWARLALAVAILLVCIELTLRVLATWFLPPPDSANARAVVTSFVAGLLRGQSLSPAVMATTVHSQFGLDFSRSWALRFMRSVAAPVILLMLVFCWLLTGVTRIELNERGAYERFGAVVTILQPGLHLGLPWPFGVVRHAEFGVMHAALISYVEDATPGAIDRSTAEGDAPAIANRLWDSEQPTDVAYLIASSEQNRQSFQTVSASVRVLYRIGLGDDDVRAALYHESDADALVRSLAGRRLAQFFAARTLPSILGENQDVIADDVRTGLRQALDRLDSGIDVVAVTVEAIHPPAGAASAYRNVQAAEIEATTSIATERGRAQTTKSVAQRDAHSATDEATASAAETVGAARADLIDITADDRPYRAAGRPFLLERYFNDVTTALRNVPLEIVDHRLTGASLPTIDLRPPGMIQDGSDRRPNQTEKSP